MSESDPLLVLAGAFPPVERGQWMAKVASVLLKGHDEAGPEALAKAFDSRLVHHTYDGIAIGPLYTADDAPAPGADGVARVVGTGAWDVRQRVDVTGDGTDAAGAVLTELERGATSILLGLREAALIDADLLDRVLAGSLLDIAPIALDAGERVVDAARGLMAVWDRRGLDPTTVSGTFGADPIGESARGSQADLDAALADAAELGRSGAGKHPGVRALVVDATVYHDAGASDAQELGCSLATAVAYLRSLLGAGLDPDAACSQLEFRYAVTAEQFPTIAKLRAARRLWSRAAQVAGASHPARAQRQHAVTSSVMMSRYDPWVNLLRTTLGSFAAGVGGADSLTVVPFDALTVPGGSERARRLARNTAAVLTDESHLARVVDPAGGSWFVEHLTDALAQAGWAWFTEIERAGGMVAALEQGLVNERLAATWDTKRGDLAARRQRLTGISEFPDITEDAPAPLVASASAGSGLPRVRAARVFEDLRDRAGGAEAVVFLATLGPPAVHTARAAFARNLFDAGGIRAVTAPPDEDLPSAFKASGARLACV
ncbi:MAG: methylmalonyl-CoA mutase subunit beta, partial [Acidimicrobiia bacterium]